MRSAETELGDAGTVEALVKETRTALRRLAKAVVVITARHGDQRFAMAATAVNELSMEPPSVLACVNRTASISMALSAGAPFCINILHASQEMVAQLCSGAAKGEERFAEGRWCDGVNGAPCLTGAQASIVCLNDTSFSYGTHDVFIGRVVEVRCNGPVDPLVYCDGQYRHLPGRDPIERLNGAVGELAVARDDLKPKQE